MKNDYSLQPDEEEALSNTKSTTETATILVCLKGDPITNLFFMHCCFTELHNVCVTTTSQLHHYTSSVFSKRMSLAQTHYSTFWGKLTQIYRAVKIFIFLLQVR